MLEPPLPFGNASARWLYVLLKGLVERGHHVTTFAICRKSEDIEKTQALFPSPEYDLRCYPHPRRYGLMTKIETIQRPYSYLFSPELLQDLDVELAKSYDILHLEQLWSGWVGLKHAERSVVNVHYLFSIDLAFQPPQSFADQLRRLNTYRAEQRLLRAFPRIITLSDRLAKRIGQISPEANLHTISLGIELSLYPFAAQRQTNQQPVVGLIGSFDWQPSYSAAERLLTRLWPEIKSRVPNARLQIVGHFAKDAFAAFAHLPDLNIYQDVPDILPYFTNTDVLLYAPIAGSGMKIKVLEAFALGTLVVTTPEGVEGLPAQDGVHAGICEDDRGLIERTIELLNNPSIQQVRRLKARQLVEKYCSPQITIEQVEQVHQAVVLNKH